MKTSENIHPEDLLAPRVVNISLEAEERLPCSGQCPHLLRTFYQIFYRICMFSLVRVAFSKDHMIAQSGPVGDSSSTSDIRLISEWCGCTVMNWLFHVRTFHFQTPQMFWSLWKALLLAISRPLWQQGGNLLNDTLNETGVQWNSDGECERKFHWRTPGEVEGQRCRPGMMFAWATADITLHDLTCALRPIKNAAAFGYQWPSDASA